MVGIMKKGRSGIRRAEFVVMAPHGKHAPSSAVPLTDHGYNLQCLMVLGFNAVMYWQLCLVLL